MKINKNYIGLTTASSYLLVCIIAIFSIPSASKLTLSTWTHPPFSDCTQYKPSDSSSVFGAEIQLLRSAFQVLNWTEGSDYSFECVTNLSTLINTLHTSQDTGLGVVGGISISYQRFQGEYMFTQPTTSQPLPLVYKKSSQGWFFRRGLDVTSWSVLLATTFIMGGLLYLLENKETAYINMLYNAFCQFFLSPDYMLNYYPSKIAHYFSTFLVMVVVIVFTAVSTNIFYNDKNLKNTISLATLQTETIYTNKVLFDYLSQFGVSVTSIDDLDHMNLVNKIDELGINYLVVDGPFSEFIVKQHCDLYTATNTLDLIHYGAMFSMQFSREIQNRISHGILITKQVKQFEQYVTEYYNDKKGLSTCTDRIQSNGEAVSLYETRGLWFLLFASLVIAAVFATLNLFGILVNKNLRVYSLKGIRAKLDRKVQRRTATIFAIHAAVSVQAIIFLKNLNKESLNNWLTVFKLRLGERGERVLKTTYKKVAEAFPKCEKLEGQDSLNQSHGSESQNNSIWKLSNALDWLRRSSTKRRKSSSFAPKQRQSISNGRASIVNSETKRQAARSSTLLKQSVLSYKLGTQLNQLINTVSEDNLLSHRKELESLPSQVKIKKKKQSVQDMDFDAILSDCKSGSITHRRPSRLQRAWGKKGIKMNKQIAAAAKTLLAQKEQALIQEVERKKTELMSLSTPRNSPLLNSLRLSILSSNNHNSPFLTGTPHTPQNPFYLAGSREAAEDNSPHFQMDMPSDGFEIVRSEIFHSKSASLIARNKSKYSMLFGEQVVRGTSDSRGLDRPSIIIKIPDFFPEDCDFNLQSERLSGAISPEYNITKYDFSQIVKDKKVKKGTRKPLTLKTT